MKSPFAIGKQDPHKDNILEFLKCGKREQHSPYAMRGLRSRVGSLIQNMFSISL